MTMQRRLDALETQRRQAAGADLCRICGKTHAAAVLVALNRGDVLDPCRCVACGCGPFVTALEVFGAEKGTRNG